MTTLSWMIVGILFVIGLWQICGTPGLSNGNREFFREGKADRSVKLTTRLHHIPSNSIRASFSLHAILTYVRTR